MGTSADLQQEINSDLKPAVGQLAADHESAKGRMQRVANDLAQAVQGKNAALIRRQLDTLNGLMADYAALVSRAQALLARMGKLHADDERSPAGKALAALTQSLGDLQGRMDRNYMKLKELQSNANKALGQASSSAEKLAEAWAEMEAFLNTNLKLYNTREKQISTLHELAQTALLERDPTDLAKIQSRNEERKGWKPTISDINTRLIGFFGETGKQLSAELRDQFTRDRIKFNKTMEELEGIDKRIDAHFKAIKDLAIKPIDAKKAADAMEIPKGNEARVKKALDGSPLVDALGMLAKDLKLKASGADLLAKLRRSKLL
jgi:hypothetical protein